MQILIHRKHFLSIAIAVQYFNQKTTNGTPIKYFLPGNIQNNIDTFHDIFVKFYTHEELGNTQSNPIDHLIEKSRFERKNVKRHPKQNNLHGGFNF